MGSFLLALHIHFIHKIFFRVKLPIILVGDSGIGGLFMICVEHLEVFSDKQLLLHVYISLIDSKYISWTRKALSF